jgi:hypothetical protein
MAARVLAVITPALGAPELARSDAALAFDLNGHHKGRVTGRRLAVAS